MHLHGMVFILAVTRKRLISNTFAEKVIVFEGFQFYCFAGLFVNIYDIRRTEYCTKILEKMDLMLIMAEYFPFHAQNVQNVRNVQNV